VSPHQLPHEQYLAEHREAVRDFARAAIQMDSVVWFRPIAPEKWSPALITEHVTLAIEAFTDDAAGRAHMALRLTAWKRFAARVIFLRRILQTGVFPPHVRAPRETRPSTTPHSQREAIENLERAARTLESVLAAHPDPTRCRLTHPYFGALPLPIALRLLTLHARHHLAQLPQRPPS
jgi:hypothetical protein